jgi:hypothetical protein
MLEAITKAILRSRITRENERRQKRFVSWDHIERIALILENNGALNKSHIDRFIDRTGKYIEVYYIDLQAKQAGYQDWHCFSKQDKSLLNLPARRVESELKGKTFDVIINTCSEQNLFALSVCSTLPAYLKCGEHSGFNLADLIIRRSGELSLETYLEETVKYLKMIRG